MGEELLKKVFSKKNKACLLRDIDCSRQKIR